MPPRSSADVEERVVRFRPTTILALLGIAIGVFLLLEVVWIARQVLTWVLIAVFLTLALNPAVDWFQRHGVRRRGMATGITVILVFAGLALLGLLFIPTLVREVNGFAEALPGYVDDITNRRGRLGFLEREYHVTERVRDAVEEGGASRVLGLTGNRACDHEGGHHGHRRHGDDSVHDRLHAAQGARLDGALLRDAPRELSRALARHRPEDLSDRRRVRDRQPPHQHRRGNHLDDHAAGARRSLCRCPRTARRDPRPDPAGRGDDRRDHRLHDRVPATPSRPGSS